MRSATGRSDRHGGAIPWEDVSNKDHVERQEKLTAFAR